MPKLLFLSLSLLLFSGGTAVLAGESASAASASSSADTSSMAASAPSGEAAVAGDVVAGAAVFKVCTACHSIGPGATNRVGPELNGLIGRKAGSVANFHYSDAMKNSGLTWDLATFGKYINDPRGTVPGNKMTFGGVHDPKQIENLTAYLASFDADGNQKP